MMIPAVMLLLSTIMLGVSVGWADAQENGDPGSRAAPSRFTMSEPILAANTPTKSVLATTVGISRSC